MNTYLHVDQISHQYGKTKVLHNCTLEMKQGELLGLLGESGSGKTTLLRLIAGFETPSKGRISLGGQTLVSEGQFVLPEKRKIGMVFQDYALFPHLTVAQNIRLAASKPSLRSVDEWLALVGLSGLAGRMPDELSGGQQQRVAIVRSMAASPDLLMLDEPFSNIDESLKFRFRIELRNLLKQEKISAIFVTHDTKDALSVADRIVVMKEGEIRQIAPPETIYDHPADDYVAGLLGPFNVLERNAHRAIIVRAEHCGINHPPVTANERVNGTVVGSTYQGGTYYIEVATDRGLMLARSVVHYETQCEVVLTFATEFQREVLCR
jgi:iron(III) transport system ATP-binding protein